MQMPDEPQPQPSFEEALAQLERIVASLEHGEPDLTAALAKYETSVRLLTHCYRLLEHAEQSVALLTGVDEQGNPLTAPFDATATQLREPKSASPISQRDPGSGTPDRLSFRKTRVTSQDDQGVDSDPPF
jgi:exodeoxyribonuclease VII small subunit